MNFITKYLLEREIRKLPVASESTEFLPTAQRYSQSIMNDPTTAVFANEAYKRNSIVFDCIGIRVDALQSAPLKVYHKVTKAEVPDCSLAKILSAPNPVTDQSTLLMYLETYLGVGGNAYLHKVRDGYGSLKQLYPYHASQMTPQLYGANWITKYRYDNGGGYIANIDADDIIHFRWNSVDFQKPWMAISPLASLAKEVDLDNHTMEMEITIILNSAIIPFAIIPGAGTRVMTDDQIKMQLEKLQTRYAGKNTGRGMILNPGTDIKPLGVSPKDLGNLTSHQIPETRIPAVFKVPLTKTSFYTSLQNSTMNNRGSDELVFAQTMVTHMAKLANTLTHGIKGERFEDGTSGDEYEIKFDASKIPALQEQQWQKRKQVTEEFTGNLITQNEGREQLGMEEATEGGDRYYFQILQTPPKQ